MASPAQGKSGRKIGMKFGKTGRSVPMASDRVGKARTEGRRLYEDASMGPKGSRRSTPKGPRRK